MNATQSCPKADRRMRRIQKVSKIFRAIFLVFLIAEVAVAIAGVTQLVLLHHPKALKALNYQVKGADWSFGFSANANTDPKNLVLLPFGFMVTLNFFRLFTRLKDGHLFEGRTIEYLEKAAKWWIALGITQIIYPVLESVFPPHDLNINVNEGGDGILCGLVVFFIAWVLREGQKLKEEQELTV